MIAVDTSVVIAALSPWHESHHLAVDATRQQAGVPEHCLLEAYATLTRMPELLRISGETACEALLRAWGDRILTPPAHLSGALIDRLARANVVGAAPTTASSPSRPLSGNARSSPLIAGPSEPTGCSASSTGSLGERPGWGLRVAP